MKSLFFIMSVVFAAPNAYASIGTLMEVTCQSVFEGKTTTRVTSTRISDADHYTKSMSLQVTIFAGETEHQEQFQVQFAHADYEHNGPLKIGAANRRNTLDIWVETTGQDGLGFAPATIKVNGIVQDYLKFECRAFTAG